ncbi:phosphopantetheine-binding protein [Aeromonas salmonicida]|uniref:phosphopantetheine-binding protein n=1 Tax=Aeromonas salmonicida TaxID=645 RepID=UPI0035A65309
MAMAQRRCSTIGISYLDSLRVMRFAAELKERNIHVSFEDLIKSPTLASWRELIANRQAIAR